MKLNYGLVSLGVVFIIIHFSRASEEFIPEISDNVPTVETTTTTKIAGKVPPPSNIVHEASVDISMTVLPIPVNSTLSPILSSTTEILPVKQVDPITSIQTEPSVPKNEVEVEPSVIHENVQSLAPVLPRAKAVVSIPSDSTRPASTDDNFEPANDVPAILPGSTEIPDSIPLPSSASLVTLPAADDFPNLDSTPPSPDIVGPLPAVPDTLPLASSSERPVTFPVDHNDYESHLPPDELRIETSEQPPHPPPVSSSSESPAVIEELPSKIPQKNLSKPPFESHELTIQEIFKESPNEDDGPIILRPTEAARVEPVYIPAPIQCPHCGRSQLWQPRREPCSNCPFCGHSMTRQVRTGGVRRPIKNDETYFKKLNRPLSSKSSSAFRAEDSGQPTRPPLQYVPVQADVNLNRRDLLRRRLNHQRVSQYMKSISPEGVSQELTQHITPLEPQRLQGALKEGHVPVTNNHNKPGRDSFARAEEPPTGSIFQFKTLRSWLFGTTSKDERMESQPIPSRPLRQNGQPTTRYFNCPYAYRQQQ